jgi:PAS domain S-box-containing protein
MKQPWIHWGEEQEGKSMFKMKRMLGSRAALALAAWVAYALAFIPLHRLVGLTVVALAMLPVVVTGWLFGMRSGLLASLLIFPLNMLLTTLVTGTHWYMMTPQALFGTVLILLIGGVVGWLHDLGEQVKRELGKRKRAEEELRKHRDHLEELVGERTVELRRTNEELQGEIAERKRAEEALRQREAVLGAMALAAEKFLRPSDWEQDMQAALAYLGKAADVSRAIIWEVSTSDDGKYLLSACYEWIAPEAKLAPQVGLQRIPVFRRWRDFLPRGEIIAGHVRDFSAKEQEFFVPRGIKSILVVPIFVRDAWWGFMGFDQGETGREWTEAEIDTLKTAASILGGALERKQAEEEIRQLKEFNEGIVQGMEEGIVMEDAEGHITFVNPKMAEMLGYTEEDLTGKHWSEIIAPSCLRQVEEESSKRPDGISSRYEAVLLRKDGQEVPGLISARPLFREEEYMGTLATFTDLTGRKEMEQQLIQAGKLAAIGQLVAGVAHELNNPLTSVVGYSQLLMGAQCSEEVKRDLERINRQAVRAARIVENLLTFARRREARKESIHINEVIERSLELQAHQLALDGISIVKELDEALPPTLADPFQMQQVFMNVINNAHQALRGWAGERRLRVRSKVAGGMIHLEFADSGPGMSAEVMGRLFEPFFTTKEVGEGMGLGLSIAYGIVEAHGGRIWAENKVGKGATFIVEIPVRGD